MIVGVDGPSGTGGSEVTGAGHSFSNRCEGDVEAWEAFLLALLRTPGGGERLGERRLLLEQLDTAVADAPGFDEHDLRAGRQQVREDAGRPVDEGQPRFHAVELLPTRQAVPQRGPPRSAA